MVTKVQNTRNGVWTMTKENTYFGYRLNDESYVWYKTKKTVLKKIKGTNKKYCRATLINGTMYINENYITLTKW